MVCFVDFFLLPFKASKCLTALGAQNTKLHIYIKTFVPMTSCAALLNLVSVLFVIFGLYFFSAGVEHAGVAGRAA